MELPTSNRKKYIDSIHTHSHTRIFFAQISCKRHLFRSSANKEICDLKAIRRAALRIASFFDVATRFTFIGMRLFFRGLLLVS